MGWMAFSGKPVNATAVPSGCVVLSNDAVPIVRCKSAEGLLRVTHKARSCGWLTTARVAAEGVPARVDLVGSGRPLRYRQIHHRRRASRRRSVQRTADDVADDVCCRQKLTFGGREERCTGDPE